MEKLASNVYASTDYQGVNVGFIVISSGAIAIDAPVLPRDARAWRQQIVETAGGPIRYVVLTDAHPDRLLSVDLLEAPIIAARAAQDRISSYTDGFWRTVIDAWSRRCPEAAGDLGDIPLASPEIMFTEHITLHKGVDVTIERVAGCAPESARVSCEGADVLFTGDMLIVGSHPFVAAAPDTRAWLSELKALRRPRFSDTVLVPGRGPLGDQSITGELSEYIALLRRRVRSLHRSGGARADRAAALVELMSQFPFPEDEQDLVQRYVKAGLDRVYDELEAE